MVININLLIMLGRVQYFYLLYLFLKAMKMHSNILFFKHI